MKKALTVIFVTLGVIFLMLIIAVAGYFAVNAMYAGDAGFSGVAGDSHTTSGTTGDAHPLLSSSQEAALRAFGIDPASVPTQISAEQEACFTAKLGAERVAQIKGGDVPTAAEFFTAKACM